MSKSNLSRAMAQAAKAKWAKMTKAQKKAHISKMTAAASRARTKAAQARKSTETP